MPQENYIAKLLDMEDLIVEDVEQRREEIILRIKIRRKPWVCPRCHCLTDQVHDYRLQRVKDSPIQGKHLIWEYRKRRYRCHCCGKRFYESLYLLPKWHRITNRVAAQCLDMLKHKQSAKDIAATLGVSPSSVGRWLQFASCKRPEKLPKVLSIDEFRGNTDSGKFQCILTAPTKKQIVDILPNRCAADICEYLRSFSNRKQVEYFIMDMNREYLYTAKALLPNAKIVIDRFHVVRYCTWALENVRRRIQKKLLPEQRKYFKRSRKLLLSSMYKLSQENKDAVEVMLTYSRDLREAYLLKEKFYEFMKSEDSNRAKERLRVFRIYAQLAEIPEFQPCLTMLHNWEPYILNAFDCSYSNGFTEGVNNSIKVLKRIAYGYRNFHNFRRRILLYYNR